MPYCSALHRRSHGVQQEIQNKLPLTHRVGQLDATDSGKRTSDPCAQSLLLTGAPGCPTESATGSRQCNSLLFFAGARCLAAGHHLRLTRGPEPRGHLRQCNSLQCSLVHGSGRLDPAPLSKQDRRARGTRRQDSQDKQKATNEFRDKSTSKCDGREEVTVAGVCDVGAGGPLQSSLSKLATSTAHQTNNNTGRADQQHQTRTKPTNITRGQTKKGQRHQNTHRQRSGQRKPKNEQERGEDRRRKPAAAGQEGGPGGGSKDRRRKQHEEKGACS